MAEFLHMGGYGAYVWSAYAVFFVVLLVDAIAPSRQRRRTLHDIAARLRRESNRSGASKMRSAEIEGENR